MIGYTIATFQWAESDNINSVKTVFLRKWPYYVYYCMQTRYVWLGDLFQSAEEFIALSDGALWSLPQLVLDLDVSGEGVLSGLHVSPLSLLLLHV